MDLQKICLESSGKLIEKRIPQSEGQGLINSVYGYCEDGTTGICSVRETKKAAIDALKKVLSKEIAEKEAELENLRNKLMMLNNI